MATDVTADGADLLPVEACWRAAGCPEPNWQGKARTRREAPDARPGVCALTGRSGDVYPAAAVVSDAFVDWDRLPHRNVDPQGVAFSPPAAWAFRNRDAMYRPHGLIDGRHREITPAELAVLLLSVPPRELIVSVPLARLGCHVLPFVEAGHVATDHELLRWRAEDVDRLDTYRRLHALGFSATALRAPAPPWPVLARLDPHQRAGVCEEWGRLDGWRAHPAYLDVAQVTLRRPPTAPIPTSGQHTQRS